MWIFAMAIGGLPYGLAAIWVTFVLAATLRRAPSSPSSKERLYLEAALVAAVPAFLINNVFTHPEVMIVVMLATALAVAPRADDDKGEVPNVAAISEVRAVTVGPVQGIRTAPL
jgi:chromate transport protein ChrA